jgi:RHS repeat-associated protein
VRNREIGTKHVYVGTVRLISKLVKQDKPGANPSGGSPLETDLYFYHPDHLGSSNYVTDAAGQLYEHLEYFPFGETWVEEASNIQRTPYLFTSKELDEETGLYYYGARYYDPRMGQFISADPFYQDVPDPTVRNSQLLNLYVYGLNNPVRYLDPDGRNPMNFTEKELKLKYDEFNDRTRSPKKAGGFISVRGSRSDTLAWTQSADTVEVSKDMVAMFTSKDAGQRAVADTLVRHELIHTVQFDKNKGRPTTYEQMINAEIVAYGDSAKYLKKRLTELDKSKKPFDRESVVGAIASFKASEKRLNDIKAACQSEACRKREMIEGDKSLPEDERIKFLEQHNNLQELYKAPAGKVIKQVDLLKRKEGE